MPVETSSNGEAPAIVVRGLHKRYGSVEAVAGVDLTIAAGEVFSLLGPNGAGKTTTVEILEGFRRRTQGDVSVLGFDPETGGRALRERIGIVPQQGGIQAELKVREAVVLYSAAYPEPLAPDEALDLLDLADKGAERIRNLSGGQRRRLDLALAIAGNPDLLFLDEPTTGFDPSARRRSWQLIENLRGLGKTILLTTHYMDEAESLADRVAVLSSGRIVAEGRPELLMVPEEGSALVRFRLPTGADLAELPLLDGIRAEQLNGSVSFSTESPSLALLPLLLWANALGQELEELTVTRPSLEDVYPEVVERARA
ncbi:MAG TPA: ABC transporter ATP-binding protein [Gaiellaceae bacterium]|nr:ABC transporter ATP-binding protein [Gaiellaceae bacterium]